MPRVLLADDNRLNQVVAAGILQQLGYDVEIVDGGAAAVESCATSVFDAVLMDVMMPDVDGYEATRRIRANEAAGGTAWVPILGLSARAMHGDREIAFESGMNDYLTKPLRVDMLNDALVRWTGAPIGVAR